MSRVAGIVLRALFPVVLLLAVAVSGCAVPGLTSPDRNPQVMMPVSPTPTPVPSPVATTPLPTPTPTPTPMPTPGAAAATIPPTDALPADGNYSHTYDWTYNDVAWSFTAIVQQARYDEYQSKPHDTGVSPATYAMTSDDRDLIRSTDAQIEQAGTSYGFTQYEDAQNVIAFVQSIPYVDDHPAGAPRYPLETLVDGQGDCKDKSVLAAALLHAMGFDVALLEYPGQPGHMALGLATAGASGASYACDGIDYYYVETTSPGWAVGEVPDALQSAAPTVFPLGENPVLQVNVTASAYSSAGGVINYRAVYTVTNLGPGTVHGLVVKVRALALSANNNSIWAPERDFDLGDLTEGQTVGSDTLLSIPSGEPSRVVCIASGDNADQMQASTADFVATI